MAERVAFRLDRRNPDVLTCIANLSNDEVFTPPSFAKQMLDSLQDAWAEANDGANIWSDKSVTFLDPFTKSGVFLREIVERLTTGLESQIPDLQKRVDHILTKQVFGIGTTELTSLIARRSVYCSKFANGKHSVASTFETESGNIWFEPLEHSWVGGKEKVQTADEHGNPITKTLDGKCKYCGASQKTLDREEGLESHAYAFIHTDNVQGLVAEIFGEDMQFDVVIGNPPYQIDDGGYGTSAAPIYHKFVQQAKRLNPRLLTMVIPARWFSGGKGLDDFRAEMLSDSRIRLIEDFPDSNEVFPGTQVKGGVCFFLWNRDNDGGCAVTMNDKGERGPTVIRPLLEKGVDVFIRYNEALPILKKVVSHEPGSKSSLALAADARFMNLVSSSKPFGFRTFYQGSASQAEGDIQIFQNGGVGFVPRTLIEKNIEMIDAYKVFIPRAGSGSDAFPHPILGKPFVGAPGTVSTETYLYIGPFGSLNETENVISYISTRLFRFLVLLHKPTQDAARSVYTFVPMQDFSHSWTDEMLYKKYGLEETERAFIEKMVRPMELDNE
jgi:site-specific DNA-methyltransferase (adenine-specific)